MITVGLAARVLRTHLLDRSPETHASKNSPANQKQRATRQASISSEGSTPMLLLALSRMPFAHREAEAPMSPS